MRICLLIAVLVSACGGAAGVSAGIDAATVCLVGAQRCSPDLPDGGNNETTQVCVQHANYTDQSDADAGVGWVADNYCSRSFYPRRVCADCSSLDGGCDFARTDDSCVTGHRAACCQ